MPLMNDPGTSKVKDKARFAVSQLHRQLFMLLPHNVHHDTVLAAGPV